MNIFLTGFMGSGKTTIGNILKNRTEFKVIDSDKQIEYKLGLTTFEIFEKFGETFFRKQEAIFLNEIKKEDGLIVVTGGATLIYNNSYGLIRNKDVIIYFNSTFPICWSRIKNSNRPLVKLLNKSEIYKLFKIRKLKYQKIADHIVNEYISLTFEEKFKLTLDLIKLYI